MAEFTFPTLDPNEKVVGRPKSKKAKRSVHNLSSRSLQNLQDSADTEADKAVAAEVKRRSIHNEIDKFHRLPGGRNNPIHTQIPASDAKDPVQRELSKSSADFISAAARGDRGRANAARIAFHEAKGRARKIPKGLEQPCPTGDCSRANVAPTTCEATGGCTPMGGAPKVGRPRG